MELEHRESILREFEGRLAQASDALNTATEQLKKVLEAQVNRRVAVDQLRLHIKQNIFYYMQAVWAHEPPDQRFFRMHELDIAWVTEPQGMVHVEAEVVNGHLIIGRGPNRGIEITIPMPNIPSTTRKLVEIADLDNLLGFKGNYMIFPLKEQCYLTNFMMQEYVDDYLGARDPDPFGTYTTEELLDYAECVYNQPTATEHDHTAIRDAVIERLTSPRPDAEEIVIPTGKLFIEALPGTHPLLENFKLQHRQLDVGKARAEVREAELENLRRAARILAGEREDPDIDKRVLVQGNAGVLVEPE
jgi:hypothetical protein